MDRRKYIKLTIVIFLIGLLVIGASYAFWTWNSNINKNIVFNTSRDLEQYVEFKQGESKFVGDLGLGGQIHSTIAINKNTNAVDLVATIHMDINSIGNIMKNSPALKWKVTTGGVTTSNGVDTPAGSELASGNFIGTNNGDTITLADNIPVIYKGTNDEANEYTVWIYLDSNEYLSSGLTGEILDTRVWVEINQTENMADVFEITRKNAIYQVVSATVVDSLHDITGYKVTTESTAPTSGWESASGRIVNINKIVDTIDTYYIWVKDDHHDPIYTTVDITGIDTTGPNCTFDGAFSETKIRNNQTATIKLTCVDSNLDIKNSNITLTDLTLSGNNMTLTSIDKEKDGDVYKYTITVTGASTDGSVTITLNSNVITDIADNGNNSVTSPTMTVSNKITCSSGQYLKANEYSCTRCLAGSKCPGGTYDFFVNSDQGMTPCDAGTYSNSGASLCKSCAIGTYSGTGSSSCTVCGGGKTTASAGSTSNSACIDCTNTGAENVSGWQTPSWSSSNEVTKLCAISSCNNGYYVDADESYYTEPYSNELKFRSSYACNVCPAGKYSLDGVRCVTCPSGSTSEAGASSCTLCPVGNTNSAGYTSSCSSRCDNYQNVATWVTPSFGLSNQTQFNYSHTSNVDDTGNKNSNYGTNWNEENIIGTNRPAGINFAHEVAIPGASELTVELYFNGEGYNYDWASVWAGSHGDYDAKYEYKLFGAVTTENGAPNDNNKFGGGMSGVTYGTYTVNGNTLTNVGHVTLTIPGQDVTFGFKSDSSSSSYGGGYGYYAIIKGNPLEVVNSCKINSCNAGYTLNNNACTVNQLTFNNQTLNEGTYGTAYTSNAINSATNGTGSYTYTIKSGAPTGATIDSSTRKISLNNTTAAGTYNIVVTARDNNSGSSKDATMTIVINRAKTATTGSCANPTYNGSAQNLASGGVNVDYTNNSQTNVKTDGDYAVTVTPKANYAWSDGTYAAKTLNCNIAKADATCPTLTSHTGLSDNSSHTITVTGGSGGTIQYRTSATGTWVTTKPTRTNAGTTTVHVQVSGDDNHNTVECYQSGTTRATIKLYNARIDFNLVGGTKTAGTNPIYVRKNGTALYSGRTNSTTTNVAFPTVEKEGYTFAGWYTAESGGTQVITAAGVVNASVSGWTDANKKWLLTSTSNTENTNPLYAHWTINNPTTPTITGGETKIYGYQATTLTCATTTTYVSGASLYYSFGYATSDGGTPDNWTTASTTNTLSVSSTEYRGTRYYSCRVYASDGTLTSSTIASETSADTEMSLVNARLYFDATTNGGTLDGSANLYVPYGVTNIYTERTNTTEGTIPTASKTGYTFAGWYTAASGGTQVITAAGVVNASVSGWTDANKKWLRTANGNNNTSNVLYAVYTINNPTTPTITGGETKIYGYQATTLTCATTTTYASGTSLYYSFGYATSDGGTPDNWTTVSTTNTLSVSATEYIGTRYYSCRVYASDGTLTSSTIASETSADTEMSLVNARLYFDATTNGGTLDGSANLYVPYGVTNIYTERTNTTEGTIPTASKTGYTFAGWYTAASGGTQVITAAGVVNASVSNWTDENKKWLRTATGNNDTSNVLYAHYTASTYTISFNANNGSGGQSADVTATYDSAMPSISTTAPTREGYEFQGWYDASSGGTQYYTAAGASARSWDKTANTTLYAQWTDTANPTVTLPTIGNNLKATSQTVNLKCTDNEGVTAYYWGTTNPTSSSQITTTTAADLTALNNGTLSKTVSTSAPGTYYLACKDAAGNFASTNVVYYNYKVYNVLETATGKEGTYTSANYTTQSNNPITYIAKKGTTLTYTSIGTTPNYSSSDRLAGISASAPSTTASSVSKTSPTLNTNNTNYTLWYNRNRVIFRYKPNSGTVTATTTDSSNSNKKYNWRVNSSNGYIQRRNSTDGGTTWGSWTTLTTVLRYGATSLDLNNYNNANYLKITRSNYTTTSGKEWICESGCTTANKTFSQAAITINATDICSATTLKTSECNVVIKVNWV